MKILNFLFHLKYQAPLVEQTTHYLSCTKSLNLHSFILSLYEIYITIVINIEDNIVESAAIVVCYSHLKHCYIYASVDMGM